MDYRSTDRSRSYRDDASHQTRRQDLDSHVSRQTGDEEAGGNAYGQRQRRAGVVGRRRQTRPHSLRDRRCRRSNGPRRDATRRAEAADQDQVRDPRRSGRRRDLAMKKREELDRFRELGEDELRAEAARLRESLFRLNFKLALGEVDAVKRIRQEKKSLARIQTIARQRPEGK